MERREKMKKRRIKLGLLALLIAGSITFGIMYIPEKPCDSFNDLAEISDYIADYIGDYLDHDIPHTNQRLNKMVEMKILHYFLSWFLDYIKYVFL